MEMKARVIRGLAALVLGICANAAEAQLFTSPTTQNRAVGNAFGTAGRIGGNTTYYKLGG